MKNLNKQTIIVATITLVIGLISGKLFLGGQTTDHMGHDHGADIASEWTCSMHPQIRQSEPGQCPICGMALIPVGTDNDNNNPAVIKMSATAMQLANVQTSVVEMKRPEKTIRLSGKVQPDERFVFTQTSHFSGRIEKLMINYTGEYVKKGQVIAFVYSPELVTAQEELFEAFKIKVTQPELYKAARNKLKNWKLTDQQIDAILDSGQPSENFPILSDLDGIVINKQVNLGDHVKQGTAIFEVADLSRIWVLFDVYESDLSWVKKGDVISYTLQSLPGQTFEGKISFIDPVINPKTRVARARIATRNVGGQLKPEMFVSGVLSSPMSGENQSIVVPKTAVMWTGERSVVYTKAESEDGIGFMLREVTLGPELGDSFVISEGLNEGEEIAVHGTFNIDAAAQLAGKPSMMDTEVVKNDILPMANRSTETFDVPDQFKSQINDLFSSYLLVKDALVQTDGSKAKEKVDVFRKVLKEVQMSLVKGKAHMEWMKDLKVLKGAADLIASQTDVEKSRIALQPLSDQLYFTITKFQVETGGYRQYCPMAFDNKGGYWLSDSEDILNPYFGDMMLTCGSVDEKLK